MPVCVHVCSEIKNAFVNVHVHTHARTRAHTHAHCSLGRNDAVQLATISFPSSLFLQLLLRPLRLTPLGLSLVVLILTLTTGVLRLVRLLLLP